MFIDFDPDSYALNSEGNQGCVVDNIASIRSRNFRDFCSAMENQEIPYVILSGYQGYPDQIESDVDFMVSETDFKRLPKILGAPEILPGARLIQALRHEISACYYIFAHQAGGQVAYLHPDATASYRRRNCLWLRSESVLSSRRRSNAGFWIPTAEVEFEYYFIKRVDKGLVEQHHLERLADLLKENPVGCRAVLQKLFPERLSVASMEAIAAYDIDWFSLHKNELRTLLAKSFLREPVLDRISSYFSNLFRQVDRILRPTGLVVAVLGPDGSGKTTIIGHIEGELSKAFRNTARFHLRPRLARPAPRNTVSDPHALPPRGWLAGLAKTMLFVMDYWLGYLRWIYPAKVRSTLVIFDRYFHDMAVDPKRYRLPSGFQSLTMLFARLIPQPDIWLVLDAPAGMLVSRKGELDMISAESLVLAYRNLAKILPNCYLVDTSTSLDETLSNALDPIIKHLADRTTMRLNLR